MVIGAQRTKRKAGKLGNQLETKLYSVEEAAEILGYHKNTIYRWIREGDLPAIVRGRNKFFINEADVHALNIGKAYTPKK